VVAGLAIIGAFAEGWATVIPGITASVGAAMLIDAPILRARKGRWVFPDGALLTGLFVGMILTPPRTLVRRGDYGGRRRRQQVSRPGAKGQRLHPAALALVATFYPFPYWAELVGWRCRLCRARASAHRRRCILADRIRKLPSVLAFLGCFYALVTAAAFFWRPALSRRAVSDSRIFRWRSSSPSSW